jgi:prepilin-type N-terminal cleavage/methylation domain-containing protein
MSDPTRRIAPVRTQLQRRRDSGMTLPELLISISMIGIIVTALSMSVIVTLRQAPGTQDRVDLARQEQSINFDMPKDLASAEEVDKSPSASPCGSSCPSNVALDGSNAVMLTWTTTRPNASGTATVEVITNVSYYFGPSSEEGRFELRRIECVSENGGAWSCNTRVILDDLDGPPGGAPFLPGSTEPTWIIQVSQPLKADATSEDEVEVDPSAQKDANRVVVTITGSGTFSGGAISQIAITAGGTSRKEIPADSTFNAPTFEQAISKCGGPVTLVLDNSGSVGSNISQVRAGAREFVKAFAGTPTQVQVIIFSSTASVLGAGGEWTKYYDLTDPAQVEALIGSGPDYTGGLIGGSWGSQGSTNWEDAMFRAFFDANGNLQKKLPERVVFFTDGEPTYERLRDRGSPGVLVNDAPPLPAPGYTKYRQTGSNSYVVDMVNGTLYSTGREYSQVAFDRADWLADQVRGTVSMIGVGVGGITTNSSMWVQNPGARYDIRYEQGYRQYKMGTTTYQVAKGLVYQRWTGSSWQNVSYSTFYPNRNSSSYRIRWDGYPGVTWQSTTKSTYDARNFLSGNDTADGYRYVSSEQWITKGLFDANNTGSSPDTADGYWDAGKQKVYSDGDAMDWELDLSLTADGGGIRPVEVYSPTGAYAEEPDAQDTANDVILARLVAGGDNAIRATYDAEGYATNAASANLYILPSWDKLSKALFSIAMAECGGTVTLSTKLNGGGAAPDPFTFQNSGVWTYAEPPASLEYPPTVVTTSPAYKTRTFTFDMSDGLPRYVEIIPHDLSSLTGYSPASTPWSCKAGITNLTAPNMEPVTIPGEAWTGVRLKVAPNTAVSCTLNVTR